MAQDDLVKVRLGGGLLAEARGAAGARGLSEWIREAMREKLDRDLQPSLLGLEPVRGTPAPGGLPPAGRAPRREPCEHRVSPAAYCKECDA